MPEWYAVTTRIKGERAALRQLEQAGFEAYLPQYRIERYNRRLRVSKVTTLCLFPRYLFVGIDNARFRRAVEPGDQLILNATFERHMRGIWKFKACAEVDGVVAAEAGLICTVRQTDGDGQ